MSRLDPVLLAEKAAALERHLERVSQRLPESPSELEPMSDASDAVILHLWQAVQLAIDLAVWACIQLKLGAPASYADAFLRLADAGHVDKELARRLTRAAGFRNIVAHAYHSLDLTRIHHTARSGPADLRALVASLRRIQ